MHSICAQCLWKQSSGPTRQFVRGKQVLRQYIPTLDFHRYIPQIVHKETNGVKKNIVVWRARPGQTIADMQMAGTEEQSPSQPRRERLTGRARMKAERDQQAKGKNPNVAHPRHLFRALLRECTYLPDHIAAREMKAYIIYRFRGNVGPSAFPGSSMTAHKRLVRYMSAARRGLTQLQQANLGRIDQYTRTLLMAYGRVGKRRHQLIARIKKDDEMSGGGFDFVQETLKKEGIKLPPGTQPPVIGPKMYALLRSQTKQGISSDFRATIKSLATKIPETTIWGTELPKKRAKNKVVDWYKGLMDGVLPPLPQSEYMRLRNLANGLDRSIHRIARRPAAKNLTVATGGHLKKLADMPADGGTGQKRYIRRAEPLSITTRFVRRRFQLIYQLCPIMTQNPDGGWDVKWGDITYENVKNKPLAGELVERSQIDPKNDPRDLRPIKEAWEQIEGDWPEGDAKAEVENFMTQFHVEDRHPPPVPSATSEKIALPQTMYDKAEKLIGVRHPTANQEKSV